MGWIMTIPLAGLSAMLVLTACESGAERLERLRLDWVAAGLSVAALERDSAAIGEGGQERLMAARDSLALAEWEYRQLLGHWPPEP